MNGVRPCPWVSCKHHLYLEVNERGSIRFAFPDREPDELAETCVLDVADRGGGSLADVGELMNFTRERIRQIEEKILRQAAEEAPSLREYLGSDNDNRSSLWDEH